MKETIKMDNKDGKKSLVIQAGIRVLREKGISNTSMNDIIRESGLSKGGVYHYFSSKNELLAELFNYFFELYATSNLSRLQNDATLKTKSAFQQIDALFQQHESTLDIIGEDMSLMLDLYIEAVHNRVLRSVFNRQYKIIFAAVQGLIEGAQRQGDIQQQLDSRMISASLLAVFDGFGIAHQVVDESNDYPRMALDAARLILSGASTKA